MKTDLSFKSDRHQSTYGFEHVYCGFELWVFKSPLVSALKRTTVCVISVPYNPYNRQTMIITRDFSAVCVSLVDCNTLNRKQVATIEAVVVLCFLCSVWTALYGATNGENIHHGTSVCVCKIIQHMVQFQCSTFVNRWTHWPFVSHAGPIWNRQVMQSTLYRSMSTASVPHYF